MRFPSLLSSHFGFYTILSYSAFFPHPNITLSLTTFNVFCSLLTIHTHKHAHTLSKRVSLYFGHSFTISLDLPFFFYLAVNYTPLNPYGVAPSTPGNHSGWSAFSSFSYPTLQRPQLLVRLVWRAAILFMRYLSIPFICSIFVFSETKRLSIHWSATLWFCCFYYVLNE